MLFPRGDSRIRLNLFGKYKHVFRHEYEEVSVVSLGKTLDFLKLFKVYLNCMFQALFICVHCEVPQIYVFTILS